MTGGLDGFLLEVVLFSEGGYRKAGNKKTRTDRPSGLSVPPKAHGTAPDAGSGILSFLLVSRTVRVVSGWVSSFHLTILLFCFTALLLECEGKVCPK